MRLWDLWSTWLNGHQVQDQVLWGASLLFWGRIGKVLEFVAGLVAVVDLLDPDKLRRHGAAARERLRQRRDRAATEGRKFTMAELHHDVVYSMVATETFEDAPTIFRINTNPPRQFGPPAPFIQAEYDRLRETTLTELDSAHRCPHSHSETLCSDQVTFVNRQVADFLDTRWSEEDKRLIVEARRIRGRGEWAWLISVPVVCVASPTLGAPLAVTLIATMTVFFIAILASLPGLWSLTTPWLWVRAHPAGMAAAMLAGLLDKTQPLHVLRKIALALFVVGFHFDLLAS